MRCPGIEPGPSAWKADILTTELRALDLKTEAFDGIRTRDLSLTKRVLCQLSYEGIKKWRIRVSIPVPRACKARTLPIELIPLSTEYQIRLSTWAQHPIGLSQKFPVRDLNPGRPDESRIS